MWDSTSAFICPTTLVQISLTHQTYSPPSYLCVFMQRRTWSSARFNASTLRIHAVRMRISRLGSQCRLQRCRLSAKMRKEVDVLGRAYSFQRWRANCQWKESLCHWWPVGCPPGAREQKAMCAQSRYKAWSCRNHGTGSVGGKQTGSPHNSSSPNLHSPPKIPVWNLTNSPEKCEWVGPFLNPLNFSMIVRVPRQF